MSDSLFRDVIEAEYRTPQERRPELAEFALIREEDRVPMFIVQDGDIQDGSASLAWSGEEKIKIGVVPSLSQDVLLSSRFARRTLHFGWPSTKIKRVFIPHVNHIKSPAPADLYFSQRTLDLVRRGFLLRASSLNGWFEDKTPEELDASDVEISSFVRERLLLTFGGMADILVQCGKPNAIIAYEGSFIDVVDIPLFSVLSNSICADIVQHLRAGGRIEAGWGKLRMKGSGVLLVATGTPVSLPEPVGRAKLIE